MQFVCDYCGATIKEDSTEAISLGCKHYPIDSHKHIRKLKRNKRYHIIRFSTLLNSWNDFNTYPSKERCEKAFRSLKGEYQIVFK